MPETKIEERIISGTGLVRLPALETATRYVSVLIDVIRQPTVINRSFKYNPPRQRYATLVFVRGKYVIEEIPCDYSRRRIDYVLDVSGQTLIALKCAHNQILGKLGGGLSVIKEFPNLEMIWDEIHVVCQDDTALQVRLLADTYSECGEDYYQKKPPPPPPPLPPVTPGTPIGDISPPYEDDDVTNPFPEDSTPPPTPEGGDTGGTSGGRVYSLTYQVKQFPGGSVLTRAGIWILGPVGDVRFKSATDKTVQVWCTGRVPNRFDPPPPLPIGWVDIPPPEADTAVDLVKVGVVDVTP